MPVHKVKDLIAIARARPGEIAFGSSGPGGGSHLGGELFNLLANVKLLHVPYKGSALATISVLSGETQVAFNNPTSSLPHIRAGRLRLVAVTTAQRWPLLPGTPTIAESGVPGYEHLIWNGLAVRSGGLAKVKRGRYAPLLTWVVGIFAFLVAFGEALLRSYAPTTSYLFSQIAATDEYKDLPTELIVEAVDFNPGDQLSTYCGLIGTALMVIAATYLGIARGARDEVVARVRASDRNADVGLQRTIGAMDEHLLAAESVLRITLLDFGDDPEPSVDTFVTAMLAKRTIIESARTIGDLAMDALGGRAYRRGDPVERAWRDLRAGPFHPLEHELVLRVAGQHASGQPITLR